MNDKNDGAHRKSPRIRLWKRSGSEKQLASGPLESVDEDSPALPPPSPGSPPRKTWERQYRSYLTERHQDDTRIPPASASLYDPQRTNVSGATKDALKSSKSPPTDDVQEKSVRGGKMFAKIFRNQSSSAEHNNNGASTVTAGSRRRMKSLSHGSLSQDELDGTRRGGAEKAYSPGNSRFRATSTQSHNELDQMPSRFANLIPPSGLPSKDVDLNHTLLKSAPDVLYNSQKIPSFPNLSTRAESGNVPNQNSDKGQHARSRSTSHIDSFSVQSALMTHAPPPPPQHGPSDAQREELRVELDWSSSSAIKKVFTEFHNSSETGRDAVSAYLGDEPHGTAAYSLAWTQPSHHSGDRSVKPGSLPRTAASYGDLVIVSDGGTSSTRASHAHIVHENIHIAKGKRVLKPVLGANAWKEARRYLIAPAVLATCPTQALSAILPRKERLVHAPSAVEKNSCFDNILLGECLLSYLRGPNRQSSKLEQQWSSACLVLRQNYLLEYDPEIGVCGTPRGFAHLQLADCELHSHFNDALELTFYGSPCAKSDKRVLMIRIMQSGDDERHHWMKLLKRAATLSINDLYEYDLKKPLSKGGSYSTVYAATRRHLSVNAETDGSDLHDRALKVFDKHRFWRYVVNGRERADTLVRETSVQATLTARCKTVDSFCRLTGFFETSENVVLELELLDGRDLFNFISERNVLPEKEAALVLRDILETLEQMSRLGLAHRDIKPSNILVCSTENGPSVKVGDFGMATFVGVDGQVRGRCGTPGYVAPEVFFTGSHGGYGNQVDVFSAGVTLYVMLSGYEPFYGETDAELVEANKRALVEYPREEFSKVSQAGIDLLQRMMHPDPALRLSAKDALQHPWLVEQVEARRPDYVRSNNNTCVVS